MRGWLAVNLFLILLILVAAGLLMLCFRTLDTLNLPTNIHHVAMAFAAVATIIATGLFGREALRLLERRSRAR